MQKHRFEDFTDVYEAMINWPKRLAHEEPFYRRLFNSVGAKGVLDAACGTGRHAAMFHSWGLRVEGADVNPQMIEQSRAGFGEPAGLGWVVRGFEEPIKPTEPFDAVLCTGNSLALAGDTAAAEKAVGEMFAALRPGGALVVHLLNLWRLPDGPSVWQKCQRASLARGEVLIVKGVHRCGRQGFVDLIVAHLDDEVPEMQADSVPFLGLEQEELDHMARQAGAREVRFFGGYHDEPYDRATSTELVMVGR